MFEGASPHTKAYAEDLRQFTAWAEDAGRHRRSRRRRRPAAGLPRCTCRSSDLARASRARKTASLRSFFSYLARQSLIPRSPAVGLRSVKTGRRLPKFLRADQIEALLAAPDRRSPLGLRDRALLETLYASGMRAGELVTISLGDVDFDEGVIRVDRQRGQRSA